MDTAKIAENYRNRAAEFTRRVEGVPAGGWDADTPCEGWTARDLMRHIVEVHARMPKVIGQPVEPSHTVEDDPVASWYEARDTMQRLLDDPAKAGREYDGAMGRTSVGKTVDTYLGFDLVVHCWDLARATGQDETLPPEEVSWVFELARGMGDNIRHAEVCGPEVSVPETASEQDRMLGYLGRRP
ncbi:maleylpyruvate isomerase family mycothiol-dependent enzyme [Streptomonospora sediminis]